MVSASSLVISLCLRRPLWLSCQSLPRTRCGVVVFPFLSVMVAPLAVSSLNVCMCVGRYDAIPGSESDRATRATVSGVA